MVWLPKYIQSKEEGIEEGMVIGREKDLEEGREKGLKEGREVGVEIGRMEGIEEGIEIGNKNGEKINQIKMAIKMFEDDFEMSFISKYIEISEEELRAINDFIDQAEKEKMQLLKKI